MYDLSKTRELLKIAAAYSSQVTGEYIVQLKDQLLACEVELSIVTRNTTDLRAELDEANRRLFTESQAHRATKDSVQKEIETLRAQKADLLASITAISADARGAKRIATETLAKFAPPVEGKK